MSAKSLAQKLVDLAYQEGDGTAVAALGIALSSVIGARGKERGPDLLLRCLEALKRDTTALWK